MGGTRMDRVDPYLADGIPRFLNSTQECLAVQALATGRYALSVRYATPTSTTPPTR